MNKQTAILAGFILLLYCNLTAFYLGCQSGLNPGINANWAYADSIFTRITNAHYNNTMTSIHTDNALGTLKTKLINHGLKSVLIDYRTGSDIEPSHWKSPSALALSNSMVFEAEFMDGTPVRNGDNADDGYWYCSNGDDTVRVGKLSDYMSTRSYGYTWVADPDSLEAENGYVFSNLKWRWRPDKRVGDQFQFTGMHLLYGLNDTDDSVLQDFYAGKYLNITFAFTMGKLASIADTDTLLSFELIGYSEDGADSLFSHINQSSGTSGQITHLIKEQYAGLETEFTYGNKLLTIKVSLLDLYLGGYLTHRDGNYYKTIMGFISPRLFWHGNGSLELDYILMEDSVFDELQNITSSTNGGSNYITSATDVLSNHGDIFTNVYAFNEPRHPQMKSYADIENQLSANISSFPGLVTSVHDHYRDYFKSNGKRFDNPLLFLKQVKPKIFMPNPYYLEADYHFNDDGLESVQEVFKDLASKYKEYKLELIHGNYGSDHKYQICVQTMGHWWGTTDIPFEINPKGFTGWSWLRPPKETQKAMKFLPLCYGVDGIHDFMFQSFRQGNEPGYWHAINLDNGVITPSGAYYGIQEANKKIATFGPLLSSPASHDPLHSPQLTWIDAITLPVGLVSIPDIPDKCPETNLSDLCLYGLTVVPSANGYYEGFVQAGLYKDMASGLPSFMLVNRRANYFNNSTYISPKYIPPSELDLHFVPAEAQTVRFFFNQDYQDIVGDYCGLYEPGYEFYPGSGTTIDVPIDAGDGRLLQLVGTLPEVVNTDATLKSSVVLSGQIQLSSGVSVDILSDAKVIIFPDTHFVLDSFSSLCLRGDVSIGDNVRFTVAEGASLIILEAECSFEGDFTIEGSGNYVIADSTSCTYQANASILITDGINAELSGTHILQGSVVIAVEDGSSLLFADSSITRYPGACVKVSASSLSFENCRYELVNNGIGNGVEVTDFSTLSMENSVFNQVPILVSNSDLSSINCDYIIRRGHISLASYGIKISDPLGEHTLRVVNSEDGHGFWGSTPLSSANPSFGIDLNVANSPLIISNVSFDSLSVGILKSDAATCSDSLLNCSFTHCKTGIKQISLNTNGVIENCSFTGSATGISLMGSLPTINSCSFIACETGVYFEDAYYAPRESGIYNSVFQMCDTAMESRSANPRVENCDFYLNDVGLKCHNDSNANLSYNAGNSFRNRVKNIQFIGDNYYHSYIQLLSGHNDFWNFGTPNQGIGAYDFHFDDFYDSATGSAIDATRNWFEADSLIINIEDNPIYQDYVIVEAFDEFPNSSEPDPDGGNRYLIALNQEASGQFEQAIAQYKTILNDGLESEKHYYNGCVDGLFRVQCLEEMQAELLAGFLDQKIVQYTAIDSAFCKLLSDYQIRAEVASGDFQSAVNIVQARIDNPVSAVDSLRAVLDLEIILQLESMSGTKKPLSLKYTQYKYPNVQVFHTKHDDHLKQLYALMGHGSEQDQIPIPNKALISSNYPNPFNPSTTIAFSIPEDGLVKLGIYNVKGQKVKDLCDSEMLRGHHKIAWDGRDKHQRDVSSGIYFVRLQASGAISTRKIMLMK